MNTSDSIRLLLAQAQQLGLDRLDAQMLLLSALGRNVNDRAWLIAHDDHPVPDEAAERWQALVHRRLAGEPVAYLVGEKPFFGLDLRVDARVLVPRPDTETLVQWALDVAPAGPAQVLDLGTGSGAIALAIKSHRPDLAVTATDASPAALEVARANAHRLGLDIQFASGSWFQAVPDRRFDLVVSNPPYIVVGDPHLAALQHEPMSALTSGADGLDDIRHLVGHAPQALKPGGWLLLEHGHDQAHAVRTLLAARGFHQVTSRADLSGIERCSGGIWPVQT